MRLPKCESEGHLEWECSVHHSAVRHLKVRLVPSDTKDHGTGKCSIELWAQEDDGWERTELAYCRGLVCPRDDRFIVLWLGRSDSRVVHPRIRGRHSVSGCDDASQAPSSNKYTVAEAIFGIIVAIASLFCVKTVELQAKDNGSGRLIELYARLGFTKRPTAPGEITWMEAPIALISRIAPREWFDSLVPASFDAVDWLRTQVTKMRLRGILQELHSYPPTWTATWPPRARVLTKVSSNHSGGTRVMIEASLVEGYDEVLAWASANVRLEGQFCRLIWLGRPRSQAVHAKVKGCPVYGLQNCAGKEDQREPEKVSVAIGLLGVVAALAYHVGAKIVHVQALDNGSGKLVQYLHRYGLVSALGGNDQQPLLSAPCETLIRRCCPEAWESQLPGRSWREGESEHGKLRPHEPAQTAAGGARAEPANAPESINGMLQQRIAEVHCERQEFSNLGVGVGHSDSAKLPCMLPKGQEEEHVNSARRLVCDGATTNISNHGDKAKPLARLGSAGGNDRVRSQPRRPRSPATIRADRRITSVPRATALPDCNQSDFTKTEPRIRPYSAVTTNSRSRTSCSFADVGRHRLGLLESASLPEGRHSLPKEHEHNERCRSTDPLAPLKELAAKRNWHL